MGNKISLDVYDDGDMAYLTLENHPGKGEAGATAKQVALHSLVENYRGPDIYMDFDHAGNLIGLELLLN